MLYKKISDWGHCSQSLIFFGERGMKRFYWNMRMTQGVAEKRHEEIDKGRQGEQ